MNKTLTKIDNIKSLYAQVNSKSKFLIATAEDLGKRAGTLKSHWFSDSGLWSVPEEHEDRVIELLQKTIKNQSK